MTELKKLIVLLDKSVKDMAFVPFGTFNVPFAPEPLRSACHSGMVSDLV